MGSESGLGHPTDGEGPLREVCLAPFRMDTTVVTNAAFETFVSHTGYETDAERFGWSFVFHLEVEERLNRSARRVQGASWWIQVPGAAWHAPAGPGSHAKASHPVVHVSWNDAVAFSNWTGKRLPTEAEWEYAARGGLEQATYPWGDEFPTGEAARANIFEGVFPTRDTGEDGYAGTAPVDAYQPNGYGLYNMVGNVWEWTADWFSAEHSTQMVSDPPGPVHGEARVIRGGSFLCHDSYCNRYRVSARSSSTPDSSTSNMGFRLARSADPIPPD